MTSITRRSSGAAHYWAPLLGIAVMVVVVAVAMAAGYWATTGRQVAGGEDGGGRGPLTAGSLSPAGLKGWMTIEEACTGLGCSVADFLAIQGLPAGTSAATLLRELEAFGTTMETIRIKAAQLPVKPR